MVAANSTMAGAYEIIQKSMRTADTNNGEEHRTPTLPKEMSSGPTIGESMTTNGT